MGQRMSWKRKEEVGPKYYQNSWNGLLCLKKPQTSEHKQHRVFVSQDEFILGCCSVGHLEGWQMLLLLDFR